eukprot:2397989-Amphidinium_carterae.1
MVDADEVLQRLKDFIQEKDNLRIQDVVGSEHVAFLTSIKARTSPPQYARIYPAMFSLAGSLSSLWVRPW